MLNMIALLVVLFVALSAGQVVRDGGFEMGPHVHWMESSLEFVTLICNSECAEDDFARPHSGEYFLWLGGTYTMEHAACEQDVDVPENAQLSFWAWFFNDDAESDATLYVQMSGEPVKSWIL